MIVVSDTTAISNLVQISQLYLLQILYSEVIIPESVYAELQILVEEALVESQDLQQNWIIVKSVEDQEKVAELRSRLDKGEAEAIVLGLELGADYLLIDEKLGRLVAVEKELRIIGTIGILLEAKKRGLVASVSDLMDELRKIGFWISDHLYLKIRDLEKKI